MLGSVGPPKACCTPMCAPVSRSKLINIIWAEGFGTRADHALKVGRSVITSMITSFVVDQHKVPSVSAQTPKRTI